MSFIKDAHWIKLPESDFSSKLSITIELPIEAIVDSYSVNRLDMRAEMGEVIFEELHTYLREHNIKP